MGVTAAVIGAGVAISAGQQIITHQQRQKQKGELGAAKREAAAEQAKADAMLNQKQSAADRQASIAGGIARRRMQGNNGLSPLNPKVAGTPALPLQPVLPGGPSGAGIGGQPARKTLIGL